MLQAWFAFSFAYRGSEGAIVREAQRRIWKIDCGSDDISTLGFGP